MRGSEKLTVLILVAIPVLVATVGWPMFLSWAAGPPPPSAAAPTPAPGAEATQAAVARGRQPTARPTLGAPATVESREVAAGTRPTPTPVVDQVPAESDAPVSPASEPTPAPLAADEPSSPPPVAAVEPAPASPLSVAPVTAPAVAPGAAASTGDPRQAVSSFYSLVASHQFDSAAQLWSPRMRAAFPPDANLTQRFSQTNAIRLQRVDLVSQDQARATVAVDLLESAGSGGPRHYVGNWYLVRGSSGWMLDQPQLAAAP